MVWQVDWSGGFVVGGDDGRRLTPNFRLKEFRRADGSLRVHRELVSALQMLRNQFGKSVAVRDTDADGLGAVVKGTPVDELERAAEALAAHRLFDTAEKDGELLKVRIPDPDHLPDINLEAALDAAFSVTAGFETAGDRFRQVTGNFDGAGLSFGPAQVNFGTGTLVPLFREFQAADEGALRACFSDPIDYEEWVRVLDLPKDQQIAWADNISAGPNKYGVVEPWNTHLRAVGKVQTFRAVMVRSILTKYGKALLRELEYLRQIAPAIQVDHLRCVCALYDLVIQQGGLSKAKQEIERRVRDENPQSQEELVRIAVEERGKKARSQYVSDCLSRRVGILEGVPVTIDGRQRANINFYMLRDVRVANARELMSADVSQELARVSEALAAGRTIVG